MTFAIRVATRRRAVSMHHDPTCLACGHGLSLHPQREPACIACDERASVELASRPCTGYQPDLARMMGPVATRHR